MAFGRDRSTSPSGSSAAGFGWSIRSTAPATICAQRSGWCVSVALVEDGKPVIGVLDAPARGEHWTAEAGQGRLAQRKADQRQRPHATLAGARVPADQLPRVDADLVPVAKPNSIALRIAMVAAGEADLVATLRWGFEWDIAAAALIASEAGATVTGVLGQPLAFNTASGEAFGVLVASAGDSRRSGRTAARTGAEGRHG